MGKSRNQKRLGNVITIRVNPKDCMSVVDVLDKAGINTEHMSFAMMCSLAMSSIMQTLRDNKIIPEREGWEYSQLVGPHVGKSDAKKIEVTKVINSMGSELNVRGVSQPQQYLPAQPTLAERSTWAQFQELAARKNRAETDSSVIWSDEDEMELSRLAALV